MFKAKLNDLIGKKNSLLCVGLDSDPDKIPRILHRDPEPLLKFNQKIIEATAEYAVAYKLNLAFYEVLGSAGWTLLEKTLQWIPADAVTIADAKRGDIGNTARKYAETFFQTYNFDAVTLSPYLGFDSIQPFLEFSEKCSFVICLTSNPGSTDFQYLAVGNQPLYQAVARKVRHWSRHSGNLGLVIGATRGQDIRTVRETAPDLPFLIPGIGAQGGNLREAVLFGTDAEGKNSLINISRSIIYAASDSGFAEAAARMAAQYRQEINQYREEKLGLKK
ncbi:MAG: orotidine-5'-phosphate decarboxylase [Calditrichia bacterium]